MQSIIELTDKILSLTVAHPKPCQISARRLMTTRDGMTKMSVLFDFIGFEYSKQLFDRINSSQWRVIQEINRDRNSATNKESDAAILLEIYTEFLIESMSSDSSEYRDDPFLFLKELNSYELSSILGQEDPTQIAFISLHWSAEEMATLLGYLKPNLRRQVIQQILRLERIPPEALEMAAERFSANIKLRFQGLFDGVDFETNSLEDSESIQSIVADIDLETERKMLDYIKSKSTSIKLQFKDMKDI